MIDPAAVIVAITGLLGLIGGWYFSSKKDRAATKHNELDILIEGFSQLAQDGNRYRTEAEQKLGDSLKKLFDCEDHERRLRAEVEELQGFVETLQIRIVSLEREAV